MDFQAIKNYIKLVEVQNFSQAAEQLNMTQPTLSLNISKTEKELNTKLIFRTTKRFELTPAGKTFYEYAKSLDNTYEECLSSLKSFSLSNNSSILRIGVFPTLSKMKMTNPVLSFSNDENKISIELYEHYSEILYQMVEKKKLDVAIINRINAPNIKKNNIEEITLMEDRLVLLCGQNHPFSNMKSVSLEEIGEEPFIRLHKKASVTKAIYKAMAKHNLNLKVICECETTSNMIALVDEGYGISFLTDRVAEAYATEKTKIVKITPRIPNNMLLITLKENLKNKVVSDFIEHMKRSVNERYSK